MNNHSITIKQFSKEGKLNETYSPLQNLVKNGEIQPFVTKNIKYDLNSYLNIDTQLSYDDSINLILNNNNEIPRIINSQFRTNGDFKYEYLIRNQGLSTNIYNEESINSTSDLFLRSTTWPIIDLLNVNNEGILMGGNYVFYIKYCDADYNETEIVSESSIVSIFKGSSPVTAQGTIMDSRTSKNIELYINNLDTSFNKFNLYFSRDTCDSNGIILTKYYKISEPYTYTENNIKLVINGYENTEEISRDELVVKYNYFAASKTQAIVQNILFLGNVQISERNYPKLQQLSYRIGTTVKQKSSSIGYINSNYKSNWNKYNSEYYDPKNVYYYLGYWPDEYYKLGICYILNDGTTTEAFNLYGGKLELNKLHIWTGKDLEINKLLDYSLNNSGGVFKIPDIEIINHDDQSIHPIYFEFTFNEELLNSLRECGVQGYFFVRSKRKPISLFQGLSVGIDKLSGIPVPYISSGIKTGYVAESFLNKYSEDDLGSPDDYNKDNETDSNSRILSDNIDSHLRSWENVEYSGLLALDPIISPQLKNILSWSNYKLKEEYKCNIEGTGGSRLYQVTKYVKPSDKIINSTELIYIDENIPLVYLDGREFSTRAGNAETANEFAYFGTKNAEYTADNLLRGIYSPFIGTNTLLSKSSIYTIKNDINSEDDWVTSLLNNSDSYYSITNRYSIENTYNQLNVSAYRGDCFTNTISIRINRNFIDPTFPANNKIVDKNTWRANYRGQYNMTNIKELDHDDPNSQFSWANINLGDLNVVPLGQWVTFKCMSNYNLGLRSIDSRDFSTMGKLGSNGNSFYPISGINVNANGKMPESQLLNEGYSVTLSRKSYIKWIPTPYENWNFENRIAFSNVASTKMFTNGFRVFQGLAYQDVDKQFGQIVKLFPYAQNLLCVFEHGLAIVPINEKALLSTQEGLSIHLYGAGVLQEQVSVISPDYGSTWMESLIKTPDAYYGVDTSAKKIWKFNNTEGFQCISDFKIQSFLNDNLNIDWDDKFFMGATNVRTHYNNFKGDVIFTFYNEDNAYSLCYNERMKMWVSKYSWIPLLSANIDNYFYSFDREIINKYTNVLKQSNKSFGIICKKPIYDKLGIELNYNGILSDKVVIKITSVKLESHNIISNSKENYSLITNDNDITGIYFDNGIEDYNSPIGILNSHYSELTGLNGIALYSDKKTNINLFINTEEVTSDMLPIKTMVYKYKEDKQYITTLSNYEWQSEVPPADEKNWWVISTNVSLKPTIDSDGNIWYTATITDGWSSPLLINNSTYNTNWHKIIGNSKYELLSHEDYPMMIGMNKYDEKIFNNLEVTSVVPIKIDDIEDDDFTNKEFYVTYIIKTSDNKFILYTPNIEENIIIKLEAWNGNDIVETYDLTITNKFNTNLQLYKHSNSSNICKWYGNPHPFEYEFVVNQPAGFHKMFNNLMIISNNVEPESLEVEIIGDSYDFKEEFIKQNGENIKYKFPIISLPKNKIYQTKLNLDKVTNENRLIMHQDCLNIKDFGRRLGNISYIEGKWYVVLQPIYYEDKTLKTTRLRDKWAKIRIKYSGEKLAIITAIQTLMNISYV